MPHVVVKLYPGRSAELKAALAEKVASAVIEAIGASPESVSVSVEDVPQEQWLAQVYLPEIVDKPESLYRAPGYDPRNS